MPLRYMIILNTAWTGIIHLLFWHSTITFRFSFTNKYNNLTELMYLSELDFHILKNVLQAYLFSYYNLFCLKSWKVPKNMNEQKPKMLSKQ